MVDKVRNAEAETAMIPVHISRHEVLYFNYLQSLVTGHKQDVDPETGLRAYPGLSEVIRNPQMQELFMAVAEIKKERGSLPGPLQVFSEKEDAKIKKIGIPPIPSDEEADIHILEETGQGNDKILVMMPIEVVQFLDEIQGSKRVDPKLNLQEFGFFDEIVRVVATVGGAFLGGPAGAVAGNAGARMLQGQKPMKAIKASLPNALYAYGAQQGLGAAGMAKYAGPTNGLPQLHSMMSGAKGAGAMATSGGGAAMGARTSAAQAAGQSASGSGGIMSGLSGLLGNGGLMGAGLVGAGMFMSHKAEKEKENIYKQEKSEHEERKRHASAEWNSNGMGTPMTNLPGLPLDYYKRRPHKKGGMVLGKVLKGPGHGQEDLIHKDIPENTWIHDAHTVGNWGNGTTEHGQKVIETLEKFAVKKLLTPEVKQRFKMQTRDKPLRKVPCAVANGERETPPIIVAALGGGSNDTGANILRDMTESLRIHKISKGHKLPPAAPDIIHHYKRAAHKHGMEIR